MNKPEWLRLLAMTTSLVFLFTCSDTNTADRRALLHGMYKLYIIELQDSSGNWQQQEWGKGGDGYIVYDGVGHMGVQITPKGYSDFSWLDEESAINNGKVSAAVDSLPADSLRSALKIFSSNYVYFGTYTVSDTADVVTHQRISGSFPTIWNTTVQRKFSFHGDTIILEPITVKRRLKWIRMQ